LDQGTAGSTVDQWLSFSIFGKPRYELELGAVVEAAGALGLLSLEEAALLSFAAPPESLLESGFESPFDSAVAPESEPDELPSDDPLFAA
jgi:hypothetical protein